MDISLTIGLFQRVLLLLRHFFWGGGSKKVYRGWSQKIFKIWLEFIKIPIYLSIPPLVTYLLMRVMVGVTYLLVRGVVVVQGVTHWHPVTIASRRFKNQLNFWFSQLTDFFTIKLQICCVFDCLIDNAIKKTLCHFYMFSQLTWLLEKYYWNLLINSILKVVLL